MRGVNQFRSVRRDRWPERSANVICNRLRFSGLHIAPSDLPLQILRETSRTRFIVQVAAIRRRNSPHGNLAWRILGSLGLYDYDAGSTFNVVHPQFKRATVAFGF